MAPCPAAHPQYSQVWEYPPPLEWFSNQYDIKVGLESIIHLFADDSLFYMVSNLHNNNISSFKYLIQTSACNFQYSKNL